MVQNFLAYLNTLHQENPFNRKVLSLLFAFSILMNENGEANSDEVQALHSQRLTESKRAASVPIIEREEFVELYRHGYLCQVIKPGGRRFLKFKKPFADMLDADLRYQIKSVIQEKMKQSDAVALLNKKKKSLFHRVEREFRKATYISDIQVNDEEYCILKSYLQNAIRVLQESNSIDNEACFATAVVQTAIRVYREGNFWKNFFVSLSIPHDVQLQGILGRKFLDILRKNGKFHVQGNEYVQNILLHCFVTDYYLEKYFEFLYKFYEIDLDRDLNQLDREIMDNLIASICDKETKGRSYMLVQQTRQAVEANQRGAKIRIRNHLKLLDRLYWNPQYERKTKHRIYSSMQKWAKTAKELQLEIEYRTLERRRSKKQFTSPYIRFEQKRYEFSLVLPVQNIKRIESTDVFWQIDDNHNRWSMEVALIETVAGYKTEETSVVIECKDALAEYRISLIDATGNKLKSFFIKASEARFFDEEGYPIHANAIKVGTVVAISRPEDPLYSSALLHSYADRGMLFSVFQFEYEDILRLPNGKAVIIGKRELQNGLIGKGRVENASCTFHEAMYELYHTMPHLVLRMPPQKANGTSIAVNGKSFRLVDIGTIEFDIDDRTGDTGYYLNLAELGQVDDGLFEILVDIPGGVFHKWEFVFLKGFHAEFEGAPYVFEPRGVVTFPNETSVVACSSSIKREKDTNAFQFEIEQVGRYIGFNYFLKDQSFRIDLPVPAVFVKKADGTWTSNGPIELWHAEMPDVIELSVPYHKIVLSMDKQTDESDLDDEEDSDADVCLVEYRKNKDADSIICDIRRFQSYLCGEQAIKPLCARFGSTEFDLYHILTRSIAVSCEIIGDFQQDTICIDAHIIGKGEYYADVYRGEMLLREKLLLTNGKTQINSKIENGKYSVKLFESIADDSGFDEIDYRLLARYEKKLIDPYDMSGRTFKLVRIESGGISLPLLFSYYVQSLKKSDHGNRFYTGTMVVKKNVKENLAAFPVCVEFFDLQRPREVWIQFIDECEEATDFLYDTERRGLLQEENPQLRKRECYRRYSLLDPDLQRFQISFCDLTSERTDGLPNKIVFEESYAEKSYAIRFVEHTPEKKKIQDYRISTITWKREAYECLRSHHFLTLYELSRLDKESFKQRTNATDNVVDAIEQTMRQYGFCFLPSKVNSANAFDNIQVGKAQKVQTEDSTVTTHCSNAADLIISRTQQTQESITVAHLKEKTELTSNQRPFSTEFHSPKEEQTELSVSAEDLELSKTSLPPLTYNCFKNAGYRTLGDVKRLYEKKGEKGLLNVNRSTAEMRRQIMNVLKQHHLV